MDELTGKLIPEDFQVNTYLQEDLVRIYKICFDMHRLQTDSDSNRKFGGTNDAKDLYDRLRRFRPRLERSLQRGHVYWGFLKKRRFDQWDIAVCIKYFLSFLCITTWCGRLPGAPIAIETLGIVRQAKQLSGLHQSSILRREIRDIEQLFWATRESDIASLIFMVGFGTFWASIIFTIAQIFRIDILLSIAFWAGLLSSLGAILATNHFLRKLYILLQLQSTLGGKIRQSRSIDQRCRQHSESSSRHMDSNLCRH